MPRDGAFCPRCRSFIGSGVAAEGASRRTVEPAAVTGRRAEALAEESTAEPVSAGPQDTGTRHTEVRDVVEEAVRSSMATKRGNRIALDDDPGDDPYPSDSAVARRRRPAGAGSPRSRRPGGSDGTRMPPGRDDGPPPLARFVAWILAVPDRVRTTSRRLGALPVVVLVVVLALLASGGLLYAVGAFDSRPDTKPVAKSPVRVLAPASFKASCAAKPSTTAAGKKVTFGAKHLVDGETTTGWRCPGDGSRQQVTFSFAEPVEVTKVALVPGWATKDPTSKADRFAENGAPTAVAWRFDKTSVKQRIARPEPAWATMTLDAPVTTRAVTMSIDAVRKGERRAMVAVSEIRIYGR
ncbi:MAG: hypothetical protein GEV10_13905 [Streptosporangiales bacterium]|nr:hypothetical protein [Streptosporangiales bacterium]